MESRMMMVMRILNCESGLKVMNGGEQVPVAIIRKKPNIAYMIRFTCNGNRLVVCVEM
jgi:hypothetical protein